MARSSGTVIMCGQRPSADLGRAEHRVVRRHHEVAGQREPEAAGQGVALDPGDGRLAEGVEVAEQVGELPAALVEVGEAAARRHALQVGPGAERRRCPRR